MQPLTRKKSKDQMLAMCGGFLVFFGPFKLFFGPFKLFFFVHFSPKLT